MNAILFLYACSIKNRLLEVIRSPKLLAKTLGLTFIFAIFVAGAVSGAIVSPSPAALPLFKGLMFVLFIGPFLIGRYGGIGPFTDEQINFVFTAPILPRTVLFSEVLRRVKDMTFISLAAMAVFAFMGLTVVMEVRLILLAGIFCFILAVVCKLFGMYLFVAYKGFYRWIGLFWVVLLLGAGVFYFARAGWEVVPGLYGLIDSYVFALTPLIGWATAGAFAFLVGNVIAGVMYTGLLFVAGGYFFWVIYNSSPDFYDEALGVPDVEVYGTADGMVAPAQLLSEPTQLSVADETDFTNISNRPGFRGVGAAVFFDKHLLEESGGWLSRFLSKRFKASRIGFIVELIGAEIFVWTALAVLWGLYARGLAGDIEWVAMLFRTIGVPSSNILALLIPSVLIMAAYPQYDKGFMELFKPYFYLVPDSPARKLLWASIAGIAYVCAVALLVLVPAGIISGTSPVAVVATVLAYFASAFMVLALRLAIVRVLGVVSGGRQRLVATLPVILVVLVGVVGMLTVFYFGPERFGLVFALLGFAGYCGLVGVLGFWFSLNVLHDVDAPI